jgi:hypothetical protein
MSNYKIGKDVAGLEARVARLEQLVDPEDTESHSTTDADTTFIDRLETELVGPDGNLVSNETLIAAGHPSIDDLTLRMTGGCERWNTGFPRWENLSSFSGKVWLQRKDNGERIPFYFI